MGLKPKTFKGLKKKNIEKGTGGDGLFFKKGEATTVQFLQDIDEWAEYKIHSFQEDGWKYVPCTMDDDCPLCDDESDARRKTGYRFAAVVFGFEDKKVQIINGPKDLAGRLFARYEKNPEAFLRRTWDITKMDTNPISYDVEIGEKKAINPANLKILDVDEYLEKQMTRYYGEAPAKVADVEDDEEFEEWEEAVAEDDDEDEFDPEEDFAEFDDFLDEEDEDEEEPEPEPVKPPAKKRAPAKKPGRPRKTA